MTILKLTPDEINVIGRVLHLLSKGELIEEWEFSPRIGVDLDEFRLLLADWPNWDDSADASAPCLAINNSLNDVLYSLGLPDAEVYEATGVRRAELARIYRKWATARGWNATGIR